jgi:hypothetical protein
MYNFYVCRPFGALKEHTQEECPQWQYECPHCWEAGEYKETHLKECPII